MSHVFCLFEKLKVFDVFCVFGMLCVFDAFYLSGVFQISDVFYVFDMFCVFYVLNMSCIIIYGHDTFPKRGVFYVHSMLICIACIRYIPCVVYVFFLLYIFLVFHIFYVFNVFDILMTRNVRYILQVLSNVCIRYFIRIPCHQGRDTTRITYCGL